MDTALQTQQKILFLENLERDTGIDIKNRVDYNTAMKYRENHPVKHSHHAILDTVRLCTERLAVRRPSTKGSGLKLIKRRVV